MSGARLVLAVVLGAAAISKLRSRRDTRAAATGLGIPDRLTGVVAAALAPIELIVSVLLVPGVSAYWAALAALALVAAFTALVATNLKRGNHPPCACFGASSDEPISTKTLLRNVVLLVVAAAPVLAGPSANRGLVAWATEQVSAAGADAALAAIALVSVVQAAAVAVLYSERGRSETGTAGATPAVPVPQRPTLVGWPPGTRAPDFSVESVDGLRLSLGDLLGREKPVLLLFTDPSCAPCNALLPEVAEWQESHHDLISVVVVSSGTIEENRRKREQFRLRDVLVQAGSEVADAYRYEGTPGAVLIGRDGRIASRIASGAGPIRSLFTAIANELEPPARIESLPAPRMPMALPVGEPAPPVRLGALGGGEVDLREFEGRLVVLLFWSPSCGYCRQVRDEVLEWEGLESTVQLVVISSGGVDANVLQGFASPVLLEEDGATLRAFGAPGTPSAALIDASGRLAAPVAAGTDDTMSLLQRASQLSSLAKSLPIEH